MIFTVIGKLPYKMIIMPVKPAPMQITWNTTKPEKGHKDIVPLLHGFATDFLRVKYMFWANQEPYFKEDLLPCFSLN